MEKIKISQAIVVEGKYDKIKLSSICDAVIIVTNGFGIYKNKETVELIRFYARQSGIIILTDSDSAGFRIRQHIKSIVPGGKIYNLYIPEIFGKEKRKNAPSKEGKLGVEGISADILRKTFEQAGLLSEKCENSNPVTKMDFFQLGLNGSPDSSKMRGLVIEKLKMPKNLTTNALLEVINTMMSREEFYSLMEEICKENEDG